METSPLSTRFPEIQAFTIEESSLNSTSRNSNSENSRAETILIIQSTTASVGIIANLTVIVVFLNHKKLRRKIPNIFIINQVRKIVHWKYECYHVTGLWDMSAERTACIELTNTVRVKQIRLTWTNRAL